MNYFWITTRNFLSEITWIVLKIRSIPKFLQVYRNIIHLHVILLFLIPHSLSCNLFLTKLTIWEFIDRISRTVVRECRNQQLIANDVHSFQGCSCWPKFSNFCCCLNLRGDKKKTHSSVVKRTQLLVGFPMLIMWSHFRGSSRNLLPDYLRASVNLSENIWAFQYLSAMFLMNSIPAVRLFLLSEILTQRKPFSHAVRSILSNKKAYARTLHTRYSAPGALLEIV